MNGIIGIDWQRFFENAVKNKNKRTIKKKDLLRCNCYYIKLENYLHYYRIKMSSHKRGGWRGRGGGRKDGERGRNKPAPESDNPIIREFQKFATNLDHRHDKRERLVKLSRDITIESKRIIFLLHRVNLAPDGDEDTSTDVNTIEKTKDNVAILEEAESRLLDIQNNLWRLVAAELADEDPWFYLRAYTAGLQEYIEAASFFFHLKHGGLIEWFKVQEQLTFKEPAKDGASIEEELSEISVKGKPKLEVMVPRADFMLGIADLTGEVMRQAINAAGSGNTKLCFTLLKFLQEIHDGFVILTRDSHREIPKKLHVLHSSLRKVETVCYNINVRGTEVPKHLLGTYLELSGAKQQQQSSRDFDNQHDEAYDI